MVASWTSRFWRSNMLHNPAWMICDVAAVVDEGVEIAACRLQEEEVDTTIVEPVGMMEAPTVVGVLHTVSEIEWNGKEHHALIVESVIVIEVGTKIVLDVHPAVRREITIADRLGVDPGVLQGVGPGMAIVNAVLREGVAMRNDTLTTMLEVGVEAPHRLAVNGAVVVRTETVATVLSGLGFYLLGGYSLFWVVDEIANSF